jgi:hypothetical protein
MTVTNLIKADREIKKKLKGCTTVEGLNNIAQQLFEEFDTDDEHDLIIDQLLLSIQKLDGKQRNTKNCNQYSWLTTRQFNEKVKADQENLPRLWNEQ